MTLANTLVEVTRGQRSESQHVGSVVLANANGGLLGVIGERQRPIFPRSAIKIIQALPLVESGAADRFNFSPTELALACGSHGGDTRHVATAYAILERIGLNLPRLACGEHAPLDLLAHHDLIRTGQAVTPLHNNCSGKHAGMLATARHLGEPIEDYELAHHQVQRRIRDTISEVTQTPLSGVIPGIDGCSAPNWPIPLANQAIAFARIVAGTGFNASRQSAFERLLSACWLQPDAMAGRGRLDTTILERFPGDVFIKGGAEGVYCGGIRRRGIGFALKIHDGAQRAAEIAAQTIIARFVDGAEDLAEPAILKNASGIAVGDIRPAAALLNLLDRVSES